MSRTYCLKIMIKRDKLIVFLGSVGIGKSTVIKGLAYVLKARGFRTYRIFIKAFHGSAYILWVFIVKLLGLSDNSKYSPWLLVQRSLPPELINANINKEIDDVPTFIYTGGDVYVKGFHIVASIIKGSVSYTHLTLPTNREV